MKKKDLLFIDWLNEQKKKGIQKERKKKIVFEKACVHQSLQDQVQTNRAMIGKIDSFSFQNVRAVNSERKVEKREIT